jgi:hypothetical protein
MKFITGAGGFNEEKAREATQDTKTDVISLSVSVPVPVPVPVLVPVPVPVIAEAVGEEKGSKTVTRPPSSRNMPKLSDAVKALINASRAKPGYTRAGPHVEPALERLAKDAGEKKVGLPAWVTVSVS